MNDIAVVTYSWMRNAEEAALVERTVQALGTLAVPVIIADKGSEASYVDRIKAIQNVQLFPATKGMMGQVLLSHEKAADLADYFFYTQSDKEDFAKNDAQKMLAAYRESTAKGVLIAARTKESNETYPRYQRIQEEFLNFFMGDYIGNEGDYFAGPKIYPASLASYFSHIRGDIGWGTEAFIYTLAKRKNMPFAFHEVFITSPQDVDDEEKTKQYRLEIVKMQIDGFFQGLATTL